MGKATRKALVTVGRKSDIAEPENSLPAYAAFQMEASNSR